MVPGIPNTGPLLKSGKMYGTASTTESGTVDAGVLGDVPLQELVGLDGEFAGACAKVRLAAAAMASVGQRTNAATTLLVRGRPEDCRINWPSPGNTPLCRR